MIRHYIYQLLTESLDSVIASNPHIPEEIIRSYHQNALPKNNKALNDSIGRVSRIAKNELERRYNTV